MHKLFLSLSKLIFIVPLLFLATSCSLENDNYDYGKLSAISLVNAVPEERPLEVFIDRSKLTEVNPAFGYGEHIAYRNVYPGERSISIFKAGEGDATLAGSFLFEAGKIYSFFISGGEKELHVQQIEDKILVPESGYCSIRFVHMVKSMQPQALLVNNKELSTAVAYKEASDFISLNVNSPLKLSLSGNKNITHEFKPTSQGVYTILLQGDGIGDGARFKPTLSVLVN